MHRSSVQPPHQIALDGRGTDLLAPTQASVYPCIAPRSQTCASWPGENIHAASDTMANKALGANNHKTRPCLPKYAAQLDYGLLFNIIFVYYDSIFQINNAKNLKRLANRHVVAR